MIRSALEAVSKGVGETIEIIGRLPEDGLGRIQKYEVDGEGNEKKKTDSLTKAQVFIKFTGPEVRALTRAVRKHPAAASRLSASIPAVRDLWETGLAEYKTDGIGGRA